ncbi:hypothetical protein ACFFX0_09035 [Citricoccus parietis]|uniref:Uncharacterized protein n=1 Tax=Citricoccus parietis TaxID=592307 RepID=A0ABV5FXC6_9MICC
MRSHLRDHRPLHRLGRGRLLDPEERRPAASPGLTYPTSARPAPPLRFQSSSCGFLTSRATPSRLKVQRGGCGPCHARNRPGPGRCFIATTPSDPSARGGPRLVATPLTERPLARECTDSRSLGRPGGHRRRSLRIRRPDL